MAEIQQNSKDLIMNKLEPELVLKLGSRRNQKIAQPYTTYGVEKTFLPEKFKGYWEILRDFSVRDDDVWILSLGKAGTTWTKEIVWLLMNDFDFDKANSVSMMDRVPFFEHSSVVIHPLKPGMITTMELAEKMSSPRVINSHLPWHLLPWELSSGTRNPKIVYVARNPKDVAVSHYHHRVLIEGYLGSLDDHIDEYVNDLVVFCPYWDHLKKGWSMRNEPNVLFTTYEEMTNDIGAVVDKTASFLNKTINQEQKEKLLNHVSFESMKKNPKVNLDERTESLCEFYGVERKSHFIRKGKVGSWREELSEESIRKLDEWIFRNKFQGLWDDL